MPLCIFFPLAGESALPAEIAELFDGAAVFLTAAAEEGLSRAARDLPSGASCAGGAVTGGSDISDVAPAVVACAETLGGIDALIFAPLLSSSEPLFLDISPSDFSSHMSAIKFFFAVCKCALPYMMGREGAVIAACLPTVPANLTERMYRAAMESMLDDLSRELDGFGISVKKFYG